MQKFLFTTDLEIRVAALEETVSDQSTSIQSLQETDVELEQRVEDLEDYIIGKLQANKSLPSKVMFSQVSVILFKGRGSVHGRGVCVAGVCVWQGGVLRRGVCVWRGVCLAGVHVWQERRSLQRTVHILLECILVLQFFSLICSMKRCTCSHSFDGHSKSIFLVSVTSQYGYLQF